MDRLFHFEPDGGEGDDGGTGADDDTTTDDTLPNTPEEIKAVIEERDRLKAQAAKGRTEAARAAKAKADADRAKAKEDGDVSALQQQLDDERAARTAAEKKLQSTSARGIATALGAVDAALVAGLIDWDTIADPDDENEVRQHVRAILKAKPFLRSTTKDPDAGKGGGEGPAKTGTDLTAILRRAAGHRD